MTYLTKVLVMMQDGDCVPVLVYAVSGEDDDIRRIAKITAPIYRILV